MAGHELLRSRRPPGVSLEQAPIPQQLSQAGINAMNPWQVPSKQPQQAVAGRHDDQRKQDPVQVTESSRTIVAGAPYSRL